MGNSYAELAEFAGGFVHEIKNHLGTLGLNLQLLNEDLQDPQTQKERRALARIQRLQKECERLTALSNDFLRFARIKEFETTPTDLAKLIDEMIDFFEPTAKAANIDLRAYMPADLPPVPLHADSFRQAILNLLLNAEQAMPEGGHITLQAIATPGPSVSLSVIDTGKGIPPEALGKIFEPFFSTKSSGSGLGLPTTKRIIEAHRGEITVESEVGKGTKFTIKLPTA